MGDRQREELMSSLKLLYTSGEYSDLTISCRDKQYRVHKAIVCPRSKFLTTSEAARKAIVNLPDDDPKAVEMAVHYLYHLDYSSLSTKPEKKATNAIGLESGAQIEGEGHWKANGHNGHISEAVVSEAVSESRERAGSVESLDNTIPSAVVHSKEKNKKKKKKRTSAQPLSDGSTTDLKDSPIEETGTNDEQAADGAIEPPPEESLTYSDLLIHAKVYTLSKKYGIEGLKALAFEKFEYDTKQNWASDDFLQAAKEVYTSPLDDEDRGMREVITVTLYEHPELLDRKETQKAIKGLDLGFDLLMRVRVKGGFGDA